MKKTIEQVKLAHHCFMTNQRTSIASLLLVVLVSGCQLAAPEAASQAKSDSESTAYESTASESTAVVAETANLEFVAAASGKPQQATSPQAKQAAQAAFEAGRAARNSMRYTEAERRLEEAVRLDPQNVNARTMLQQVRALLGDRRGEISSYGVEQIEQAKIRKQQALIEIQRLYRKAVLLKEAGEFTESANAFDRVLEQIEWYHFGTDLSSLKSEALSHRSEARSSAVKQRQRLRRELEENARLQADGDLGTSRKFLQERLDRLMKRAKLAYDKKQYQEAISLTNELLELQNGNREARFLNNKAHESYRLYKKFELRKAASLQFRQNLLDQMESEVSVKNIFNYPSREHWDKISNRAANYLSRSTGEESGIEAGIKAKLNTSPISIEFPDTPFLEAINTIQSIVGINFVLTKEARESVTDNDTTVNIGEVKDLPLKDLLNLVLEAPGFRYVVKSGAILIGSGESLREDVSLEFYEISDITRTPPNFPAPPLALDDSDGEDGGGGGGSALVLDEDEGDSSTTVLPAEAIKELLEKSLYGEDGVPEGESLEVTSGKLVARTTIENHNKIEKLLRSLRKSTGILVTVESRFIDLQDNFLESIGVDFGNPFSTNLPNAINDIDGIGTSIAPGYEFTDAQGQTNIRAASYNDFSLPLGSSVSPFQISGSGGFGLQYNVLEDFILEAIIEANAKTQKIKQASVPRVTAFNTQIAHSLVIEQSAYVKDAEVNQTGVVPVINPVIGILNSGSILEVRPTVSYDRKYINLEIQPTLATQLPSRFRRLTLNNTNLEVELPTLSVTKIKTTITVPDGGTVLVGGLKRSILQEQQVGVPWFSRIPGLNILFGRKGEAQLRSNLFVLINAKITSVRDEERKNFN